MKPPARPAVPRDLRLVSYVYLLAGAAAATHMVVAWVQGRPLFNAAVLAVLLGWRLLQLRPGWRRIAVISTVAFPLVGVALTAFLHFANRRPVVRWAGFAGGPVVGLAVTLALLALIVWQLRVLTSARTRALFGDGDP